MSKEQKTYVLVHANIELEQMAQINTIVVQRKQNRGVARRNTKEELEHAKKLCTKYNGVSQANAYLKECSDKRYKQLKEGATVQGLFRELLALGLAHLK